MRALLAAGVLALFALGALAAAIGRLDDDDDVDRRETTALHVAEGAYRGSEPPRGISMADFALHDHTGEIVRSVDMRGKVVLLTFLDSQCTESCPLIASQVADTLDLLTSSERSQVVAVAVSTDPAEDTPASVRSFLRRNGALGKIRFLGGGEPERRLRAVWKRFKVLSSLESGEDALHSAPVRIYDRRGFWVATLHAGVDLSEDNLLHDLRQALGAPGRE
jgi:cytochrome oxidase Cu insertion factor (SCO1/SenC/PrrC family)